MVPAAAEGAAASAWLLTDQGRAWLDARTIHSCTNRTMLWAWLKGQSWCPGMDWLPTTAVPPERI